MALTCSSPVPTLCPSGWPSSDRPSSPKNWSGSWCAAAAAQSVTLLNMVLISGSVVNKTFLLNDFFSSHNLDFMFITESWIKDGDLTPFSELVPVDCTFFSSPRQNRRGGGLVTVMKNSHCVQCRAIPVDIYTSFEGQHLHLD